MTDWKHFWDILSQVIWILFCISFVGSIILMTIDEWIDWYRKKFKKEEKKDG